MSRTWESLACRLTDSQVDGQNNDFDKPPLNALSWHVEAIHLLATPCMCLVIFFQLVFNQSLREDVYFLFLRF